MYVINSHRKKKPFNELTVNTELEGSSASDTFVLPLYLIDQVEVDWGDGAVENFSVGGNKTHVYNTPGIYTIKMYGTGTQMFRFSVTEDSMKVISGVVGNTGWTNFSDVFYNCTSLTTLDVSTWDVSPVTSFAYAFSDCISLITLDVSTWDVSSVTSFNNVFNNCDSLTALDVSAWDVSSVTNFGSAFSGCSYLSTLNVSTWDVGAVVNFRQAFYGCSSLTTLDVRSWDVGSVTNFQQAFLNCSSLGTLDASAWVMSPNLLPASYNATFRNCGTLDLKIGAGWNFSALTRGYNASSFLQGTNIGSTNYDNMLSIIASQTLNNNVTFGAGNSKYTATGKVHRDAIMASKSWIFNDGGLEA